MFRIDKPLFGQWPLGLVSIANVLNRYNYIFDNFFFVSLNRKFARILHTHTQYRKTGVQSLRNSQQKLNKNACSQTSGAIAGRRLYFCRLWCHVIDVVPPITSKIECEQKSKIFYIYVIHFAWFCRIISYLNNVVAASSRCRHSRRTVAATTRIFVTTARSTIKSCKLRRRKKKNSNNNVRFILNDLVRLHTYLKRPASSLLHTKRCWERFFFFFFFVSPITVKHSILFLSYLESDGFILNMSHHQVATWRVKGIQW